MRPDPNLVAQIGAVVWLALMAALLYLMPALGLSRIASPLQVLGAGVALALLIGAACIVVSRFEDDGDE